MFSGIQGKFKFENGKKGWIYGKFKFENGKKGRHTLGMGLNPLSTKPAIGYQPTPGLVRLFSKTGTKQNTNQRSDITKPRFHPRGRRSTNLACAALTPM
jgi:hypothetical protein